MKNYLLIAVLLVLCIYRTDAQQCPLFDKAVQKARILSSKGRYVEALDQLEAAKELCKDRAKETDKVRNEIVKAIEKKNKDLEDKIKQLDKAQKETKTALDTARVARERAEKTAQQLTESQKKQKLLVIQLVRHKNGLKGLLGNLKVKNWQRMPF